MELKSQLKYCPESLEKLTNLRTTKSINSLYIRPHFLPLSACLLLDSKKCSFVKVLLVELHEQTLVDTSSHRRCDACGDRVFLAFFYLDRSFKCEYFLGRWRPWKITHFIGTSLLHQLQSSQKKIYSTTRS